MHASTTGQENKNKNSAEQTREKYHPRSLLFSRELTPGDVHAVEVVEEEPLGEVLARVHRAGEGHVPVLLVPDVRHVHKRTHLGEAEMGGQRG